jgi:aryl-phospho-beta-D-glucosidase BglC (GH1 family)
MKIRGVNLGNWLVLEKWMSPDLFFGLKAEDETYFCRELPEKELEARLNIHRSYYITERDFACIAGRGLNAVRIPVPYFIFGDCKPFPGCIDYLDKAFSWAEKYGLKILIDLHTAPDSQNGFDNGGICGVCKWAGQPEKVEFVLALLEKLAERYAARPGLWGIEILNEPISEELWLRADIPNRYPAVDKEYAKDSQPVSSAFLREFYTEAYFRLRKHLKDDKAVVFHDGFRLTEWKDFMRSAEFKNVVLDTHFYFMALDAVGKPYTLKDAAAFVENTLAKDVAEMQKYFPVIGGEWCLSCQAEELKENLSGPVHSEKLKHIYREIAHIQLSVWEKASGWFYWNYKLLLDTVNLPEKRGMDSWDLGKCFDMGWFPKVKD